MPESRETQAQSRQRIATRLNKRIGRGLTIYNWEKGKSKPRDKQLAAWAKARGIGKREAWRRLELLEG